MSKTETSAFDRGRVGQRVKAERFDEPGAEDLHISNAERSEDGASEKNEAGLNPDLLLRPDAPDLGTLRWAPKPPRG